MNIQKIIDDIIAMLPMIIFTLLAVMYHFGHKEYDKIQNQTKKAQ